MLKKIYRELTKTPKRLKIALVISLVIVVILCTLLFNEVIKEGIFAILGLTPILITVLCITELGIVAENNRMLLRLKVVQENLILEGLSEAYVEVQFAPELLKRQSDIAPIVWEDENLNRCLRILGNLEVRHFAKLEDDDIRVIAKNAEGKVVDSTIVGIIFFQNNYKILK